MTLNDLATPWYLDYDFDGTNETAVIFDQNAKHIATSRPFRFPKGGEPVPPTLAAMRLMATAPKLLEALQAVLPYAESEAESRAECHRRDGGPELQLEVETCQTVLQKAQAVIAETNGYADRSGAASESRQPIVIEVRGGVVQEVRNVPPGWEYKIRDHDDRAEHVEPESPVLPPLPPDPEGMNDARANWAHKAVRVFQELTGADDEDALCDLLADLLHWADRNRYDFGAALFRARDHYRAETLPDGG
jgi:hypothetical protein